MIPGHHLFMAMVSVINNVLAIVMVPCRLLTKVPADGLVSVCARSSTTIILS